MFSVKSALQGPGERGRAQIVSEHRCPRDGLQHRPVHSGRRQQCDNQQAMAESGEHKLTFENWRTQVKNTLRQTKGASAPDQIQVANPFTT